MGFTGLSSPCNIIIIITPFRLNCGFDPALRTSFSVFKDQHPLVTNKKGTLELMNSLSAFSKQLLMSGKTLRLLNNYRNITLT
jgi:hypothetical protein